MRTSTTLFRSCRRIAAFLACGLCAVVASGQCGPGWVETPGFSLHGVDGIVLASVAWDPDGAGPEPEWIVIAGMFSAVADTAASNIAAWDGQAWYDLGGGLTDGQLFTRVAALAVHDGALVAGGNFGRAGGVDVRNVAAWDGASWSALGSGVHGGFPEPEALALESHAGLLYVGGAFTMAGDAPANFIAAWDGSEWSALGSGTNTQVMALRSSGGNLIVGGFFSSAGGEAQTNGIARWDGAAW
ncbi:MAG: hypothetical protein KJZ54_04895, partial [Phycisphaerales bacterium]|nr:hypothetical protein [Phycisphaerales bacterium]